MTNALLWIRFGFCTGLGLAVIGLAAVATSGPSPEAASTLGPDAASHS